MRFEGTLDIAAPRDPVWSFLTDPTQVTTCAPDVQSLEVADPHHFKVVVRAGVGPIKGTFSMNVQFLEVERRDGLGHDPAGRRAAHAGRGGQDHPAALRLHQDEARGVGPDMTTAAAKQTRGYTDIGGHQTWFADAGGTRDPL